MKLTDTSFPGTDDRRAYYRGALTALRFLEARKPTGRRFGDDADALWIAVRGHLTTAERIDALLRDADTEWHGSFGARTVFALRATAEDEPFGHEWTSLDPLAAEALWRELRAQPPHTTPADALAACADAWNLELTHLDVPPIAAEARVAAAGPSAVAALVDAFSGRGVLSWPDQVHVLATPPAHRQLAAFAAVAVNAREPSRIAACDENPELMPGCLLVVSDDADPRDAEHARRLAVP